MRTPVPVPSRRIRLALSAVLACMLAACSDSLGPDPATVVEVIVIDAPQTHIPIGATVQLAVTARNATGGAVAGGTILWTSSRPEVALVGSSGVVEGRSAGTATITAAIGNVAGTVTVQVIPGSCAASSASGTIALGQTLPGSLTESDCHFPGSGTYADAYMLRLDEPASLQIDLRSSEFDPVLIVTDAGMNIVDFDDDGGGYPNSRLVRDFAAGNYFVWAVSFWNSATGAYELSVTEGPALCTADAAVGAIGAGQTLTGSLTTTDCIFSGRGTYAQGYAFTVTEPTTVRIDLMSGEFDAYLYLTNTRMEVLSFDDDGGADWNSTILGSFLPGTFILWATSYSAMMTGEYQLAISEGVSTDLGGAVGADSAQAKSVPPKGPPVSSSSATGRM